MVHAAATSFAKVKYVGDLVANSSSRKLSWTCQKLNWQLNLTGYNPGSVLNLTNQELFRIAMC